MRPMLPALLLVLASVSACADYPEINGQLALDHKDGHTRVIAHTCSGAIDYITVSADREGLSSTEQNPTLGELRAKRPMSGDVVVDLDVPGPDWEVTTPIRLPKDARRGIIVSATQQSADTEMKQGHATVGQVASLKPGNVIAWGDSSDGAGTAMSIDAFRSAACPK